MVREICTQSVEPDGIGFDPTSVRVVPIAEEAEYDGVRVQFQGRLDTIRLHMQLDFGFGDQVFPKPERSGYPTIFDMPAPSLLTYSRETAIAEKLHVIFVREQLNSRMRDYFDIWWLASRFQFDGEQLAEAIRRTCQQRKTEIPSHPVGLSQDPRSIRPRSPSGGPSDGTDEYSLSCETSKTDGHHRSNRGPLATPPGLLAPSDRS